MKIACTVLMLFFSLFYMVWETSGKPRPNAEQVYLTTLDLTGVEQGFGKPQKDHSVDGHSLSIGGRKFEHGLGTHSPGTFLINLSSGSARFHAWAGIDDEVGKRGSVIFEVIGDGKALWNSGIMRGGDPAKPLDIDVSGVKSLLLLVGDAGDGFEFDHADWADAGFEVTGARPTAIKIAPGRDPVIAPPQKPSSPILTTSQMVGAKPGAPFLMTIATLGMRPIKYRAIALPRGLKLDPNTGQITGSIAKSGIYRFTILANNKYGMSSRPLEIRATGTAALSPPLGWNSYDAFGDDVTEAETLANAHYMKEHLQHYGYEYVVVDFRWYDPDTARIPNNPNAHLGAKLSADDFGRLTPASSKFPSAADGRGFKSLADTIHAMGLKFGIHIMRGIPRQAVKANLPIEGSSFHAMDAANTSSRCPWCPDMYGVASDNPAGQAWYDSIVRQYAAWGVDLIKVDDMSSPYSASEIEAIRKAIDKSGRQIVFSLSPGDTPIDQAQHVQNQANMWRISGDFWDDWKALNHQFDLIAVWKGHGAPGHWPDADMVPLGHLSIHNRSVGKDRRTGFTKNEQVTLMTLWALAPSPIMLGMNMPDNDPFTESLLFNEEVLAINKDSLGLQARKVTRSGSTGTEVWVKRLEDGGYAVGLFNRLGIEMPISVNWSELGFDKSRPIRDIWQRKDLGMKDHYENHAAAHGAVLLKVGTRKESSLPRD